MAWSAKKTDKLEVRLPPEAKQVFLERCEASGRSASEAIRRFIDDYTARAPPPLSRLRRTPTIGGASLLLLMGVGLAALGVAYVPSPGLRLGLMLFLVVEGLLLGAAGAAMLSRRWRTTRTLFVSLALVQLTWTAQANPPAAFWGTVNGLLLGGLGPTFVLAALATACWAIEHKARPPALAGTAGGSRA